MFEFTLSKVNMLIFVTAIAVVVIFFMNSLTDNLKTRQSYELAFKIGKEIKSVVDSDSYCSIKFIDVPRNIHISQGSSLYTINYKLGLQTYDLTGKQSLIVYIQDSRRDDLLGAFNLDYDGKMIFYESFYETNNYHFDKLNVDGVIYDPRRLDSNETRLMMIKNIKDQQTTYHIIPCEKKLGAYSCRDYVCGDGLQNLDPDGEILCKEDFCILE